MTLPISLCVCVCVGGWCVCVCVCVSYCSIDKKIAQCCFYIDKIKNKKMQHA